MAKAARVKIIQQIERARKSRVISYVTSTRQGLEVQMAMDSVRYIYDHLEAIAAENKHNRTPKIDLFLHSNGGDGTMPWKLVTLIREFTDHFSVLVPFRAFSAATLTALGADSIVMHPMGMLGPTDATVTNLFNPIDSRNQRLGISVEDVTAYLALIKEDAGIQHEDQLVTAFNLLADKVHPLALGNVKRHMSQSRLMAKKLLSLHMDPADNAHRVSTIVENLTSKSYFHGHPINRREAEEQIGLTTIEKPTDAVQKAMWRLYLEYEKEMNMDTPFDIATDFSTEYPTLNIGDVVKSAKKMAKMAFIESSASTDYLRMEYELVGQKLQDHSTSVTLVTSTRGWTKE